MSTTTDAEYLVVLVLVSLIPALLYLIWVRKSERYSGEAWGPLLWAFVYGAMFATITAAILEAVIVSVGTSVSQRYPGPEFLFLNGNSTAGAFFLVLVVAPFIEEALKASGVVRWKARIGKIADGPVVGASVGLGFGFFETFLYGVGAFLVGGLAAGIALIAIRSVSSVVLHGSSTGMFGYGYARARFKTPGPGSGAYYGLAVAMHALVQRPRLARRDPDGLPHRRVRGRDGLVRGAGRRDRVRLRSDRACPRRHPRLRLPRADRTGPSFDRRAAPAAGALRRATGGPTRARSCGASRRRRSTGRPWTHRPRSAPRRSARRPGCAPS